VAIVSNPSAPLTIAEIISDREATKREKGMDPKYSVYRVTVTLTRTVCVMEPLVPVTVTV
jgi:hypothetical protein